VVHEKGKRRGFLSWFKRVTKSEEINNCHK
jgi:hypothetical protein